MARLGKGRHLLFLPSVINYCLSFHRFVKKIYQTVYRYLYSDIFLYELKLLIKMFVR